MRESSWFKEKVLLGQDFKDYVAGLLTPWNLLAGIIIILGMYSLIYRILYGFGPATHLTNEYPWGLWKTLNILAEIPLSAPGLAIGTAVYLFNVKDYKEFARPAVLASLLGYVFGVLTLVFDLGRYDRVLNPFLFYWGLESVLFLTAWHFFLYIIICFVEWFPAFFEWLGAERLRNFFAKLGVWATALGVIITGGHQAALGALFLIAPTKLHPLWYSSLLPVFFLVSAVFAGIAVFIVQASLTYRVYRDQLKDFNYKEFYRRLFSLAKILVVVLFAYFLLKLLDLAHYDKWKYLFTPYGYWYLFEVVGFVVLPMLTLIIGIKARWIKWIQISAFWVILGLILNRFNVGLIAFRWYIPLSQKYYPTWMEVAFSLSMITWAVVVYKFIIRRMPILRH